MKKVLVTGGAGFIGSNLVCKLNELDCETVVIDDFSLGREKNLPMELDSVVLYDRSICDDLSGIFEDQGFDTVFHVAALPRVQFSIKHPKRTHDVNVNGTFNLLNCSRKFGVKRFVFSSSSSVYGEQEKMPLSESMELNPISPYALQKLFGEKYCNLFSFLYGVESVSLRYFNVYGPRQDPEGDYACLIPKFIRRIDEDKRPTINGDGKQTRDFAYVGDVVEANILAATTENEKCFGNVFNIGSGRNISVNKVTREILNYMGKDINPIYGPPVIEPRDTLADIEKAKILLNWVPRVKFEEGLKESIEWFR